MTKFDDCTKVTPDCPVQATVLGYYPNLGSGIFFTVAFGICLIASVFLGVKKRTWTYAAGMVCGLILETAGYIGRSLLHYNPWDQSAFELQICAIILAPTFICVSIYLTLKHAALALNPSLSRIPAVWYPRIFLPADLSCLIVQAIGGGIAAAAGKTKPALQESGNRAIIAGIVLQVIVLGFFGIMGVDYLVRVTKWLKTPEAQGTQGQRTWQNGKFRRFLYAVSGAYLAVFVRCIYRIAEMAGGWGNHIMQDEPSFLVLDSSLVLVTAFLLTFFHPGILFPQMGTGYRKQHGAAATGDEVVETKERKATPGEEASDSANEAAKMEAV